MLELMLQSCKDEDSAVRQLACEQLVAVCQTFPKHRIPSKISKEVYNLLRDEDFNVRNEAIKTAVKLIFIFPPRFRREKVFPVFQAATQVSLKSCLPLFEEF